MSKSMYLLLKSYSNLCVQLKYPAINCNSVGNISSCVLLFLLNSRQYLHQSEFLSAVLFANTIPMFCLAVNGGFCPSII